MNNKYLLLPVFLFLLFSIPEVKATKSDERIYTSSLNEDPITCVSFLSAELMPIDLDGDGAIDGGMAEVFAREFIRDYVSDFFTECSPIELDSDCVLIDVKLDDEYDFESPPETAKKMLQFTCDDLSTIIKLAVWAKTDDGTWSYCSAILELQNNLGACETNGLKIKVDGLGCADGYAARINDASYPTLSSFPCAGGFQHIYQYPLTENESYEVSLHNDWDHLKGVNTGDIVLIAQHILGTAEFENLYQLISADVDNSNFISVTDLAIIRQLILGKRDDFPNNTSWRFFLRDEAFDYAASPFDFPIDESASFVYEGGVENLNFVGVKIGDVQQSASISLTRNANSELTFQVNDVQLAANETHQINFRAADIKEVLGFQFAMQFDTGFLEIEKVEAVNLPNLDETNFGLQQIHEGLIKSSWNAFESIDVDEDDVLFSVSVKAKSAMKLSKAISLSAKHLNAEAYGKDLDQMSLALSFNTTVTKEDQVQLYPNTPNPFVDNTSLSFYLPKGAETTMSVYDASGKLVLQKNAWLEKGVHTHTLQKADLPNAGVYFFQLQAASQVLSQKLIVLP